MKAKIKVLHILLFLAMSAIQISRACEGDPDCIIRCDCFCDPNTGSCFCACNY